MIAEISIIIAICFLLLGLRKYAKLCWRMGFMKLFVFVAIAPCIAFMPRLITMAYTYGWLPKLWLTEVNAINSVLHGIGMAFFYCGGREFHKVLDRVFLPRGAIKPKGS